MTKWHEDAAPRVRTATGEAVTDDILGDLDRASESQGLRIREGTWGQAFTCAFFWLVVGLVLAWIFG